MLSSVEQASMGKDEKRAPLKTPAWEAIFGDAGIAGIAVLLIQLIIFRRWLKLDVVLG